MQDPPASGSQLGINRAESVRTVGPLGDEVSGDRAPARYRVRRALARSRAVKVLFGEDEMAIIVVAAARAGLRPSSFVAATALASAQGAEAPASNVETREVLAELMQTRLAVRQYGTNLNQIAAALNSGPAETPGWLAAALAGAERATDRIDEAARLLTRRLA